MHPRWRHHDSDEEDLVVEQTRALRAECGRVTADSVERTRSSLRKLEGAQITAAGALMKLAVQNERLDNIESSIERIESRAQQADGRVQELRRLQRWFHLPKFMKRRRDKKLAQKLEKDSDRPAGGDDDALEVDADDEEGDDAPLASPPDRKALESRRTQRLINALKSNSPPPPQDSSTTLTVPDTPTTDEHAAFEAEHARATAEIDSNLSRMSAGLRRLREAAGVMGHELDAQTERILAFGDVTARAGEAMAVTNRKLAGVLDK
ncbi:hypothetical protein HK101_010205 [Irineochytrium annulatum]|nr:hypothetical protein HK101_010205 [Irineochytrium annulatum]